MRWAEQRASPSGPVRGSGGRTAPRTSPSHVARCADGVGSCGARCCGDRPGFSWTQLVLPFVGLGNPGGLAVDDQGDVYVADPTNNRVLLSPFGSSNQQVVPLTTVFLDGLALDKHGNLFAEDESNVLERPAVSGSPIVLPFTGVDRPTGIAVDAHDDVFVSNATECEVGCAPTGDDEVLELTHSGHQKVLPFSGLFFPRGLAVDKKGDVFVSDGSNNRVLELAKG